MLHTPLTGAKCLRPSIQNGSTELLHAQGIKNMMIASMVEYHEHFVIIVLQEKSPDHSCHDQKRRKFLESSDDRPTFEQSKSSAITDFVNSYITDHQVASNSLVEVNRSSLATVSRAIHQCSSSNVVQEIQNILLNNVAHGIIFSGKLLFINSAQCKSQFIQLYIVLMRVYNHRVDWCFKTCEPNTNSLFPIYKV